MNYETFLLQTSVSLSIFYLLYFFFLRKEVSFTSNRLYLLFTIFISILLPFFSLNNIFASYSTIEIIPSINLKSISVNQNSSEINNGISIVKIVLYSYFIISISLLIRFLIKIFQIFSLIKKTPEKNILGKKVIVLEGNYGAFTFLNYIFLEKKLEEEENLKEILKHEETHAKQLHSFDLILLDILSIFLWFNPVIWLIRRDLSELHEYLADEGVLSNGINPTDYRILILKQTLKGNLAPSLTHNFNKNLIKKRITMTHKNNKQRSFNLKILLILPIVILLMFVFEKNIAYSQNENNKIEIEEISNKTQTNFDEKTYFVVEEMPKYKGGYNAMKSFLKANVKYPQDAKKQRIEGVVYVRFTIDKAGNVTNVKAVKGVNKKLDTEAVRVISSMPKWKAGSQNGKKANVYFTIPIKFSLK